MKYVLLCLLFVLSACNGSGGGSASSGGGGGPSSGSIVGASVSPAQVQAQEIQNLQVEMNQAPPQYQMTLADLDSLKSEGAITDEDYDRLKTTLIQ
jgi:hypothetical protein